MKNIVILMLSLLLIMCAGGAVTFSSEPASKDVMCVPMGDILLEAPDAVEAKKSAVNFPHARHFTFDCKTCHHTWKGTDPIVGCSASGCHDLAVSPKKLAKENPTGAVAAYKYYKTAFHDACIGCHKKIKLQNKKLEASGIVLNAKLPNSGPTSCQKCHPRQ